MWVACENSLINLDTVREITRDENTIKFIYSDNHEIVINLENDLIASSVILEFYDLIGDENIFDIESFQDEILESEE